MQEKTIHVCIDFQRYYPQTHWECAAIWPALKQNIVSLRDGLQKSEIDTIHVVEPKEFAGYEIKEVQNLSPACAAILTDPMNEEALDLPLQPSSLVTFKYNISAIGNSRLTHYVKRGGFSKIILSGIFEGNLQKRGLDCCVRQTAFGFAGLGYKVVIAAEATESGVEGEDTFVPLAARQDYFSQYEIQVSPIADILGEITVPRFAPKNERIRRPDLG